MDTLHYIALIPVVASIVLGVIEVLAYKRRSRDVMARKYALPRLLRRMVGLFMMLFAVVMFIVGDLVQASTQEPARALPYWGICLASAFVIFVIVVIDIKRTADEIFAQEQLMLNTAFEKYTSKDSQQEDKHSEV